MYKSIILFQFCLFCSIILSSEGGFFDGLVNVNREDNGNRKVGVHLPFIYWMDLNRSKDGPKLDISVLSGFVKVNVDRSKDKNGKNPVMVRILGQKIYDSFPKDYGQTNVGTNGYGASNNYKGSLQNEESKKIAVVPESANETIKAVESSQVYNTTQLPSPPEAN